MQCGFLVQAYEETRIHNARIHAHMFPYVSFSSGNEALRDSRADALE